MDIKHVLVTGGSGLVGKAIENISLDTQYSNYHFHYVSSSMCDLTCKIQTEKLFSTIKPTYVIHLAARVGGLFRNMREKVEMLEDNVAINLNVLSMCHAFNVEKCVSCLSTCIFPDKTTYPIDETMLHDGAPHNSNDAYAYAKRLVDVQSRAYREQYGRNFITVVPTNIYGPHDNYSLDDGHVIPSLIHKCYIATRDGKPLKLIGSGSALRQFIYSDDLARLMIWALENYNDSSPIILSPNPESDVEIRDVASLIAKSFGNKNGVHITHTGNDGQHRKTANNAKLMSRIGDFNFTSMEDGIKKSVAWFIKNYDISRK